MGSLLSTNAAESALPHDPSAMEYLEKNLLHNTTRLTTEEKARIRALNNAGLCRRANGRKIGRTHFLISIYLRNWDGYNKKKDNRCETFCSSRREADMQANVQQLLVSQQDPSTTETPCLGEH
ncbi:hypothetical protein ANCCEY_12931 [Ancylostoma ceylanicum]|uniref:Uncharacterized protein n=1 Tax=Ancylostoma ceylanicum TaxID=53326 RepID=A0A0D6LA01_9BILA|nr:hypothetical protein ANCCEY_12931 [Ancylostoma ceylanicum]